MHNTEILCEKREKLLIGEQNGSPVILRGKSNRNKKMFHIDDTIDCKEFMEDVKRHGTRETDVLIKKLEKRVGKKRW